MDVKRYFAPTAREALRQLKQELGADAIVLANRSVEGGVEILALPADAVGALPGGSSAAATAPRQAESAGGRKRAAAAAYAQASAPEEEPVVTLSSRGPQRRSAPEIKPFAPPRMETPEYVVRKEEEEAERIRRAMEAARKEPPVSEPLREPGWFGAAPVEPPSSPALEGRIEALQEQNALLARQLGKIQEMIERQLAGFAWNEAVRKAPARARLLGEMLEAGFSPALAREVCDRIEATEDWDAAREAAMARLGARLEVVGSDDDLIDRGGVYAIVGPTGVGKTTTTAKIAARCVVRHGAARVALITTDGYRIGAHEQLRIYGRILGVPVFAARDANDLRATLSELRGRHMVLIDTIGMSQRDKAVTEQVAMLMGAGPVRRLVCLNATSRGDTLDDVARAFGGEGLAGCIFTKVDEAATIAAALDVAIRHRLRVHYVANGQRVPEDLHLPNRAWLLQRAFRGAGAERVTMAADEAALWLAAAVGA